MKDLNKYLKNRIIDNKSIKTFGFIKINNKYLYEKKLSNNKFKFIIEIKNDEIHSKVIDLKNNEEYLPIDILSINGEFITLIRKECDDILNEFLNKCLIYDSFKSSQSKQIIKFIKEKYGNELEYLWEKYPDTAVARRKDNKKWYLVFMKIAKNKIGLDSDELIEIINLKNDQNIVDNINIFQGYHMNKKSWISIRLDDKINIKKIYELIERSYDLVK